MTRFPKLFAILPLSLISCVHYARFEATIYKENATKEGLYLNGYVVHLDYEKILELDRQTVRISGKYNTINGITVNDSAIRQGRMVATKHILNPKIKPNRTL